jgi:hypothetical protein
MGDAATPRAALASAVERVKAAEAAVGRLNAAFDVAQREKWAAQTAQETAQRAVAAARAADSEALTAAAKDGKALAKVTRTAHAALAAERDAAAAVELAQEAESVIAGALANAQGEVPAAKWQLDTALRDVVEPAIPPMVAELYATMEAMTKARECLTTAAAALVLVPREVRDARALSRLDPTIDPVHRPRLDWTNPWPATLARLRTDANAPLPPVASGSAQ